MSISLLQSLVSGNSTIMQDIWHLNSSDVDFQKLFESVSTLQTQLEVQTVLLSTERALRECPCDRALPNQQATRIKYFVKFVFEENSRAKQRQIRLQKLDSSSLKLCGLSYTVREITELPSPVFDFLVENVADFVQSKQLLQLLCRDDINKVVGGDFDPEDEELFKEFLTSHIELRLKYRKRRRAAVSTNPADCEEITQPPDPRTQGDETTHKQKRVCKEKQRPKEEQTGRQIEYMYSKAPINQVTLLGDLLSEAIYSSRQWQMERDLGEPTTDCITTLVPKNQSQDISITLWVGQEAGFRINDVFSLVPKWTFSPNRVEP